MNRTLILCVAVFFAVVGFALLGGDSQAVAGHGCQGCDGADDCSGCDGADDCSGDDKCHGRRFRLFHRCGGNDSCDGDDCSGDECDGGKRCGGLFSGLRDRLRNKCCGEEVVDDCCGSAGDAGEEATEEAPAPEEEASASYQRVPFGFRNVHFRG